MESFLSTQPHLFAFYFSQKAFAWLILSLSFFSYFFIFLFLHNSEFACLCLYHVFISSPFKLRILLCHAFQAPGYSLDFCKLVNVLQSISSSLSKRPMYILVCLSVLSPDVMHILKMIFYPSRSVNAQVTTLFLCQTFYPIHIVVISHGPFENLYF